MEYYKLRLDYDTGLDTRYREMENSYFSCYVRSLEKVDDNPHYHYYVELHPHKTTVGLRQFIRLHFGSGNGVYSLKKLDEEKPIEYLAYLIKEDQNSVWYRMPEGARESAQAYDLQVKTDLKSKKSKSKNVIPQVEGYIKELYGTTDIHPETLVEQVVEYFVEHSKIMGYHQVLNIAQTIRIRANPQSKKLFCQSIVDKII